MLIRLAVAGAAGRMGRAVLDLVGRDDQFEVVAGLVEADSPEVGRALPVGKKDVLLTSSLDAPVDAFVDFTVPDGTARWLPVCVSARTPMVIGSTGHNEEQATAIRQAAETIPIVLAPNCSVGIAALRNAIARLANDLGEAYDVEIIEAHHRHKVDAPSGTALALASDLNRGDARIFGRLGHTGERPSGQIGIHAVRMGEVVGWHEVHFSGPGETVMIRHTAHSRDTFAAGALRAAAWVVGKDPGMYAMRDVLQ